MSQLWNIKKLSSPEPVTWTKSSGRCLRLIPIPTCTGRIAPVQGTLSFTLWRYGGSILQNMHNFEYFIPFQSYRLTTLQDAVDLNKLIISFLFPPLPFLMPIPISVGLTPRLLCNFLPSSVRICESYIPTRTINWLPFKTLVALNRCIFISLFQPLMYLYLPSFYCCIPEFTVIFSCPVQC